MLLSTQSPKEVQVTLCMAPSLSCTFLLTRLCSTAIAVYAQLEPIPPKEGTRNGSLQLSLYRIKFYLMVTIIHFPAPAKHEGLAKQRALVPRYLPQTTVPQALGQLLAHGNIISTARCNGQSSVGMLLRYLHHPSLGIFGL